jgi:hypothetical protein
MRALNLALVVLALAGCEGRPTPEATVVASGDTWTLGFGPQRPGSGLLCFWIDMPSGSSRSCPDPVSSGLGSGDVDSLGSEGSLVFGTVATRVAAIEVALEDGSVVQAKPFAPPETVTIDRNLFALQIDQAQGHAVATLLDEGGRRLATAEFRWTEHVGTAIDFEAL